MYINRIAAAAAAVVVSAALAVGLAPQHAQAASNSLSIAGVSKTNAPDIKSKGTVKTPTVRISGNVSVSSRSYVITKGKKSVAKTSTQGKTYKLGVGTYKVKSTAKYRTYTTSKVSNGTRTEWRDAWNYVSDTNWDTSNTGEPDNYYATNASDGSVIERENCDYDADGNAICTDTKNRQWRGWLSDSWDGGWYFYANERKVTVTAYKTVKKYSGYKTITKTQTVKISNSGTMTLYEYKQIKNKATLSKVKSTVGGTGKVVDRYSCDEDDYVTREFNGHYIYFENGKVYAKQW